MSSVARALGRVPTQFEPMKWRATIEGKQLSLDRLVRLFDVDPRIVKIDGDYYLESSRVDAHDDHQDAHAELLAVITQVNGVHRAATYHPDAITFGGDLYRIAPDGSNGSKNAFAGATITIDRELWQQAGFELPPEIRPPDAAAWLALAMTNEHVAEALALFGHDPLTWDDLFRVWECVEADVGGHASTWGGGEAGRFTQTAQPHRHRFKKFQPHPKPMTYDEAVGFIRELLGAWFEYLRKPRSGET